MVVGWEWVCLLLTQQGLYAGRGDDVEVEEAVELA